MLNLKSFFFNPLQTRCCVVWQEGESACAVIDPGTYDETEEGELFRFLDTHGLKVEKILLTHGHFDHVFGVRALMDRYGCPVFMHPADAPVVADVRSWTGRLGLSRFKGDFTPSDIREGDVITIGNNLKFTVIETPGHTPGGVCFYDKEDALLFSGDTLFNGTIGRTDLFGGDYDTLIRSVMDKIMGLPGETTVIPGHGTPTTIGREAASNPFLIPFNEPEPDWNQDGLSLDNEL